MRLLAKRHPKLMPKKYFSMLLGGTLTMMVASVMLMSDSFIAGAVIGSDAVAGITLVTPLYSFAVFFGSIISIGIPLLYSTEMGKFNKKRADQIFGVYVGEQNHSGLRSSFSLANKTAIIEGVIVTILLIVIAPFAPDFLNVSDPQLAGWVVIGVRLTALGSVFSVYYICSPLTIL